MHSAMALTITTNRPIVDSSSRPVNATITGRTNRLTRTRIAGPDEEAERTGAAQREDRRRARPERERLGDADEAEHQDHDEGDERIDDRLDDEPAHRASLRDH